MENIGNIGLKSRGNVVRENVTSTNDGAFAGIFSMDPMLVTSWRLENNGANSVNYRILTSKENQPDPSNADLWDELVAETALAPDAVADGIDNEAHYTAIIAEITSASAGDHSVVRVIVAGSV